MKSRGLLLFCALLASAAWAQEPASFDLSSDYIKKIVRDTAATQSMVIQLSEEKPAERDPGATIKFIPEEKPAPPVKQRAVPRPVTASRSQSFAASILETIAEDVVDTLIEEALGVDYDLEAQLESDRWIRCQARAPIQTTVMGYETCPSSDTQGAWLLGNPSGFVRPEVH